MTSVIEAIDRNYNSGNRSQKASDIFDEVGASKTTRDAYIKDTQDYLDSLNKYPVGYKRAKEGLDAYNESQGKAGKELIKSTLMLYFDPTLKSPSTFVLRLYIFLYTFFLNDVFLKNI